MSNISPQKNARTPEQNISLRNLCKNFWLEETAILDMQMSKLPMISGYAKQGFLLVKLKSSLRMFYGRHHDLVDRYGTCVTNDHGYVSLVVKTFRFCSHS